MQILTITAPPELIVRIKTHTSRKDLTVSQYLRQLVRQDLEAA